MRLAVLAVALLPLLPVPLLAQTLEIPPEIEAARPEIEDVIADQLRAFNDRDVGAAWAHASPLIQRLFGSAEAFGAMVEQGYPMVWTNDDARFGELRAEEGGLWQRVFVTDPEGADWALDYQMVPLPEGWRINGVQVVPAPDVGV
jgi:hypothetical protein